MALHGTAFVNPSTCMLTARTLANKAFPTMKTALSPAPLFHQPPVTVTAAAPLFVYDVSHVPDPLTFISTLILVTISDMVPFVPCQPLAIALGSKLGLWAFPICVVGQTLAGVFAFWAARTAADSKQVQSVLDTLGNDARTKFEDFRRIGNEGGTRVLLSLIGLRLAPFFPFSAGNYLLGGATSVGIRPFVIATIFGCLLSNFLSVGVGIGGAEFLLKH